MYTRHDLTPEQWEPRSSPFYRLVKQGRGRPRTDDRKAMNGILYVLKTGCTWSDMPSQYGSPVTC
ncbi:transposase [Salinithrix halophila]|uniref:Transposase n=1 Tax=Salinithrix halophila TaxID=1485204 RepID=A0ABV8JH98_9BACL